jgi:hypothetical protein
MTLRVSRQDCRDEQLHVRPFQRAEVLTRFTTHLIDVPLLTT